MTTRQLRRFVYLVLAGGFLVGCGSDENATTETMADEPPLGPYGPELARVGCGDEGTTSVV